MLPALAQTWAFRGAIPSSSTVLSSSSSDSLFLAAENPKLLLLHISSFHHSSVISHDKVLALIQPASLATLDIFLVFTLQDSPFFSWLPPPLLFLAHCQKHVGEEATSDYPNPCGSQSHWTSPDPWWDRLFSFLKNKAPVAGSQLTVLDTLHLEGESPQLTMFIAPHCWSFVQILWLSNAARNATSPK